MIGYAELQNINNFSWGIIKNSLKETLLTEEEWDKTIEAVQNEERKYRHGLCGMGISKIIGTPLYIIEYRERELKKGAYKYASLEAEKKEIFTLYQYGWKLLKNYGAVESPLTEEQISSMQKLSDEIPTLNPIYAEVVKNFVTGCLEIIRDRQNAMIKEKRAV